MPALDGSGWPGLGITKRDQRTCIQCCASTLVQASSRQYAVLSDQAKLFIGTPNHRLTLAELPDHRLATELHLFPPGAVREHRGKCRRER
jgi:hypothetical protein